MTHSSLYAHSARMCETPSTGVYAQESSTTWPKTFVIPNLSKGSKGDYIPTPPPHTHYWPRHMYYHLIPIFGPFFFHLNEDNGIL